jgi:hypothetical protein
MFVLILHPVVILTNCGSTECTYVYVYVCVLIIITFVCPCLEVFILLVDWGCTELKTSKYCVSVIAMPYIFLYYIYNMYVYVYIYKYYSSVNATILYRQRLKQHVSTHKVIVRLAENYEILTKWLCAFGIPDDLQYVP